MLILYSRFHAQRQRQHVVHLLVEEVDSPVRPVQATSEGQREDEQCAQVPLGQVHAELLHAVAVAVRHPLLH